MFAAPAIAGSATAFSIAARDLLVNAAEQACPAVALAGSASRHKLSPASAELANTASLCEAFLGVSLRLCIRYRVIIPFHMAHYPFKS